jgi:hypothetical protein
MKLKGEIVEISIDDLVILDELKSANPQRTLLELQSLEEQIRNEGKVKDPFMIWLLDGDNVIVDGFSRYEIVRTLHENEDFSPLVRVQYAEFESIAEARYWIGINQDARRNLTDEQKAYYYGQLLEELKESSNLRFYLKAKGRGEVKNPNVAELVSEVHRISKRTVFNSHEFFKGIEKIKKTNPVFGSGILSRDISDLAGERVVIPMGLVRKLAKVTSKKQINSLDDIKLVLKEKQTSTSNVAKKEVTDINMDNALISDPKDLLGHCESYLKNPTRTGLKRLVGLLESLLKEEGRKAA